ncbi:hypothetical protein ACLB2K_023229 [Fragaria x ananassa]
MEISRGVGTPLQIDKATKERQFGYYARVLVDVNIAGDLPSSLMVERETHCFPIEIMYENMCTHCSMVGHMADRCRQLQGDPKPRDSEKHERVSRPVVRQEYREKKKASSSNGTTEVQPLENTTGTNGLVPICVETTGTMLVQDDHVSTRNIDTSVSTGIIDTSDNGRASSPGGTISFTRQGTHTTNANQFAILAQEVIVGVANDLIEQVADQVFHEQDDQSLGVRQSREDGSETSADEGSFPTSPIEAGENAVVVQEQEDGAHEKRGGILPNAVSCSEFQDMSSNCELVHLPTKGLPYTWTNRRGVNASVEMRLDRCLSNFSWMDACRNLECTPVIPQIIVLF